ncbi:MAG: hypothetical protein DMF81_03240 [Acidobacteria bacterium]|nr:MAG: hypothetical protein DMF81_03240 [Acidobacteriota bacterium]
MSCVLRAIGEEFDVDAFLATSPLRPDAVYRKGESVPGASGRGRPPLASGFHLAVGPAGLDDLTGQVREALAFLDEHEDELRRLNGFAGVDALTLDFAIRRREGATQIDIFPSELLWRAGALDIDLTVTHCSTAEEAH